MLTEQQQTARRELIRRRSNDDDYMNQLLGDEAFCITEIAAKKPQIVSELGSYIESLDQQIIAMTALKEQAEASKAAWETL